MTEFARFFIEMGSRVTTDDYMRAEGRIAELKATFDDAFETCDLIMSPVSSFPGSITGDSSYPVQYWNGAFTMHANAIGHPAASVPAGFSPRRLAHRPPDHRPQVRRGDRPGRIGRLRAGPSMDPAPPVGVLRNGWTPAGWGRSGGENRTAVAQPAAPQPAPSARCARGPVLGAPGHRGSVGDGAGAGGPEAPASPRTRTRTGMNTMGGTSTNQERGDTTPRSAGHRGFPTDGTKQWV